MTNVVLAVLAVTCYSELRRPQFGEEHRMVLSAIRNRALERNLTVSAVCLQKKQFSYWNRYTAPTDGEIAYEYSKVPESFIRGLEDAIETANYTPGVNHFYSPKSMKPANSVPSWAKRQKAIRTENFNFYKIGGK